MRFVILGSSILLLAAVLSGCGGGSGGGGTTPNASKITNVTVGPSSVSLNAGDVLQISASAVNSTGGVVGATFTYSSSNVNVATVSPTGLVCGGVWDSAFVNCNAGIQGQTTITASADGVTSSPVTVSVHLKITSITVAPASACSETPTNPCCTSTTQTRQYVAHAFSGVTDVTAQVGPFTWVTQSTQVAISDTNGLVTAHNPGQTGISASNTNVFSPTVNFRTCMPLEIRLHVPGDLPGSLTTSATLNLSQTQVVEADMTDEKGFTLNSAPVTLLSNNPFVATITGTTVTAQSFGGAGIVAACIPPTCGANLGTPVYSNLFRITVNGSSPSTFVLTTSSYAPPAGTSSTLVPIDTSKSPPAAGPAVTLSGVPNSLAFSGDGTHAFLGTSAGLVSVDTAAGTQTLLSGSVLGKVLAVSEAGDQVIVSDGAPIPPTNLPVQADPTQQRVYLVNVANGTFDTNHVSQAVAAAFDSDGLKAYVGASNGNVYILSAQSTPVTKTIAGSFSSVASLASDPFVYLANTSAISVLGVCDNTQQPDLATSSAPQLVGSVPNVNMIVAVNQTGLDIQTATVTSVLTANPAPFTLSAGCNPPVTYSNQFIDFGLGSFTARQLLVPTRGGAGTSGSHIVVLPKGINNVLVAIPGSSAAVIPLAAGGTEPLSGGMTGDGNTLWVGVAGTNTVDRIDLTLNTDNLQIATTFKKSDGTPAPPDIVGVRPK